MNRGSLVARFAEALAANAAEVHGPLPPAGAADLAVRLARELAGRSPVAVATGDRLVAELDLESHLVAAGVEVLVPGAAAWSERIAGAGVGITGAAAGLAATGTVAVPCGPGSPRGTSLLPPVHLCLIRTVDVVEDLAAGLERLAAEADAAPWPSALVWVSGPSRSADLEMILTLGVHGPGRVEVIMVGGQEPGAGPAN